jgi:Flp pilus assembly CpaE family ATPase
LLGWGHAFRLGRKFDFSISDALERVADIDDLWQRMATEWNGFRLLPCPTEGQPPTEALGRRLPDIVASATREFDPVIADLPSSMSPTIAEIVRRSDTLYLVCTPYLVSIHLAHRRLDQLRALGVDLGKVRLLVNRFDSQNAVSESTIEDAIGLAVDYSLPNDFEAVTQASMKGGLVAPTSPLAHGLEGLTRRILGIVPDQKEQASPWKRLLRMD